ncbi:MAG: 3'-5' exonuclease [Bacteroidota bacterium]
MGIFKKTNANIPEFWKAYEKSFDAKPIADISKTEFVVLDTETTGFDYERDRILSIGAILLKNNCIAINKSLEIFLQQKHYNSETVKIHGILKKGKIKKVSEIDALRQFLEYLENRVIVAHHAHFDMTMLNKALKRNGLPRLKNEVLDTVNLYKKTLIRSNLLEKKENYSLDELADKFSISKKDRHTAMGDAYITAIAFLKIIRKLNDKNQITLKNLLAVGY